jgi:hypothetical protein
MRTVTASVILVSIIAVSVVVYAGEVFSMKCEAKTCGKESGVTFGGGMAYKQLTGYCRKCKKFVYLHWTREGSPVLDPKAKKVPAPKPLGEVWDASTGKVITIYACTHCSGPFAQIKTKDELKHCPACNKPSFGVDETKPKIAID